jgi:hypothetical protein
LGRGGEGERKRNKERKEFTVARLGLRSRHWQHKEAIIKVGVLETNIKHVSINAPSNKAANRDFKMQEPSKNLALLKRLPPNEKK